MFTLFKHFDTDNSGVITKENISEALASNGKKATEEELDEIMEKHDTHHNGVIDFEEFRVMMEQNFEAGKFKY
jgi:Ca2+-binding EF-hand superfamily protein